MKNKIIIPTDLTSVAKQAIKQACLIAEKSQSSLCLLHVLNDKSPSEEEVRKQLGYEADAIRIQHHLKCDVLILAGNLFDVIPNVCIEDDFDLMVIGTHGIKGVKQMLFGANILRLVEKISIPVLVIQQETALVTSFDKIVLPVSSHESFIAALDALLYFSKVYGTEVVLYSINKPGFDWPEQLLNNIEQAVSLFGKHGVKMTRLKEEQNMYDMGYARQTLKYAQTAKASAICMMSVPSVEYYYFAHADKETMIINDAHIPVLCMGVRKR
ncbi:MAG: universal stress protein [Bacteroidetes bacterium]|nr:universal stress protein [Bacteroidota bacterium]